MSSPLSRHQTRSSCGRHFASTRLATLVVFGGLLGCRVDTESLGEMAGVIMGESAHRENSVQVEAKQVIKKGVV
ncbi:hypothetical protein Q31b_06720 [Novipirellula aureliae]|uniref:Uncharacterized protein n=1 Tax=Novipirellula aureliae TaxID=2527966 RepID=A0A5C6E9U9_9BACT|nr:hypothetical protein [Novipirellula aureliae]TWU45500.1 hypothetical protein Q31b_06720 [Novipirellula aureliae]